MIILMYLSIPFDTVNQYSPKPRWVINLQLIINCAISYPRIEKLG